MPNCVNKVGAQIVYIGSILLVMVAMLNSTVLASNASAHSKKLEYQSWLEKDNQKIPIIIYVPEANQKSLIETPNDKKAREEKAEATFERISQNLRKNRRLHNVRKFSDPAFESLLVNEAELEELLSDESVQVFPNRLHTVALDQSVPLIFSNQNSAGFDGSGQKVVVIDTGVDDSHSFLAGAVNTATAACFSNNAGAGIYADPTFTESLCTGGAQEIGPMAGQACNSSMQGCSHGTQMAGIIAGQNNAQAGVALGAQVVPIQVFTQINDIDECNFIGLAAPCIATVTQDVLDALIYVRDNFLSSGLAAVNISFGTTAAQQGLCSSALEPVIQQIVAGGTAVIASSGNNGSNLGMTSPACIDDVIAVASTDLLDNVSTFSNANSELDYFAPGEGINTSTTPASQFADVQDVPSGGTSASAAHVSGAWAVLKSKNPSSSIADIKAALTNTGVAVLNPPLGATGKRINVQAALDQIEEFVVSDELCVPIKAANGNVVLICL